MACHGIYIVRLSDQCILAQRQHAASPDGGPASSVELTTWTEAVTKCAALRNKTIARLSYETQGKAVGVFATARKDADLGAVSVMSSTVSSKLGYLSCDKALDLFQKMFVERAASLTPQSCESVGAPLQDLVAQFADPALVADDRVAKVKRAVDDAKELALENVEKALDRGRRIEDMVEATDELQLNAQGFHRQSRALRQQLWWNGIKGKLMIAGIAAAFLLVLYVVFCGGFTCSSGKST